MSHLHRDTYTYIYINCMFLQHTAHTRTETLIHTHIYTYIHTYIHIYKSFPSIQYEPITLEPFGRGEEEKIVAN